MLESITSAQMAAMRVARREGHRLARIRPEIADEWRSGASQQELADKHLGHFTRKVGRSVVGYALRKLVPKVGREKINRQHLVATSQRRGKESQKNGAGIFAMSHQQRVEAGLRGGPAAAISRGQVPFDGKKKMTEFGMMSERSYVEQLIRLRANNRYWTWKLITLHVNAIFGNNRTWVSVKNSNFAKRLLADL